MANGSPPNDQTGPAQAGADLLHDILAELRTINRTLGAIAARLAASADMDPGRDRDPGDAVPPGVAVQDPPPMTPQDEAVRDALERLPRTEGSQA